MAIQNKVIRTRKYEIHNEGKCNAQGETIEPVTFGCNALADNSQLARHNQSVRFIHTKIALQHTLIHNPLSYYKYTPESILESENSLLHLGSIVTTDKSVDYK